ncbi:MAG: PRC-barrel domain-containing protein [Thermomicrobiales bacterium]
MVTKTAMWNPLSREDYGLIVGKDVYSRDGEKVGFVKEVWHPESEFPTSHGQHYFLMDPGLLKDWFGGFDKLYLPERVIDAVATDRVVLNLTKDQIKQAGWTEEPTGWDRYSCY